MSIEELRRSSQVTKGIPPIRLGNENEGVPKSQREQHEMARENGNHEKQSITSKGTRTTSTSLVRRRNIQAELKAHRKLAEIAKKELEIERNLIQKELELNRLAELDDIQKGVESVVLEDFSNIKENISEDTSRRRRVKYDEIQQWVDTAPSDNSFNCDFRSIDERTVVNNDVMSRCHYFDTNRRGMNHFMARQSGVGAAQDIGYSEQVVEVYGIGDDFYGDGFVGRGTFVGEAKELKLSWDQLACGRLKSPGQFSVGSIQIEIIISSLPIVVETKTIRTPSPLVAQLDRCDLSVLYIVKSDELSSGSSIPSVSGIPGFSKNQNVIVAALGIDHQLMLFGSESSYVLVVDGDVSVGGIGCRQFFGIMCGVPLRYFSVTFTAFEHLDLSTTLIFVSCSRCLGVRSLEIKILHLLSEDRPLRTVRTSGLLGRVTFRVLKPSLFLLPNLTVDLIGIGSLESLLKMSVADFMSLLDSGTLNSNTLLDLLRRSCILLSSASQIVY
ncbi:hypothetical protein JTB14_015106 [Gonioctena quinquepunctata]|nr:hypothetical protein JTB14_015106 [Gonioctena quinquepunctata]